MTILSFDDASGRLLAQAQAVTETESVPTGAARGRILANSLVASLNVPPLDNSAMDGYAVRCADVPALGTRLPISQRIAAGNVGQALVPQTAARIFTGAPIPAGADAVVMQEFCTQDGDAVIVNAVPKPGQAIRRCGEDIATGAEVIAAGTRLTAAHLGLAASVGTAELCVFRPLRVALFSTGNELTMPGEPLKPGGIYNSNRTMLHALLEGLGCVVADMGIVSDSLDATRAALRAAAQENDLILTSGGVSVGEEDHVKAAVSAEGVLDLWKIAIKPGKPFAFGWVNRSVKKVGAGETARSFESVSGQSAFRPAREHGKTQFIGLPGNPVASFVTFLMLVRPFILAMQGAICVTPRVLHLRADFAWKGDARREFLRARINDQGGLSLYPQQGSAVLTSCAWADGLIDNLPGQAIEPGDIVRFIDFNALG
ncbi:MAG: molybdopterin molybdotransferase MoeA [Rugosibacter sp.]|nr:molybdopterin molybdotransferase MoeA [Rugosibacter sp.]